MRASRWERFFSPRPGLGVVPPVGNSDSTFFAVPRSRWGGAARTLGDYEAAYEVMTGRRARGKVILTT